MNRHMNPVKWGWSLLMCTIRTAATRFPSRLTTMAGIAALLCLGTIASAAPASPTVAVRDFASAPDAEKVITAARNLAVDRRIVFVSGFFLGRKYHPETKKRIKSQRAPAKPKKEADNRDPLPVDILKTSFTHLDCMTYVEHVLALASCDRPDYAGAFLPRLLDVMFDANGAPLMSHLRNHFTSRWGDVNERKGYLDNIARGHPLAVQRDVMLNRVGANRTFYVEDRFMIASAPQTVWYFPTPVVLGKASPLVSGDVLALACDKEGLDVTHMGFYIEQHGKRIFRHASLTLNRIVDQDFDTYMREKKGLTGLMVFRPRLSAPTPPAYAFVRRDP